MSKLGDEIRALKPAQITHDHDYLRSSAIDRAAALADQHEVDAPAMVAAAYESVVAWLISAELAGDAADDPLATCFRAMTPADARTALARLTREAEARGMEMAAEMLKPASNSRGGLWAKRLAKRRDRILAAASKHREGGQ